MARRSTRNFVRALTSLGVDDFERGPEVSEDVQLQYIVDDVREVTNVYAGSGANEAAVVGEHGIMTLQVSTPRGILVDQVSMRGAGGAESVIHLWEVAIEPTITGSATVVVPLQGGGLGDPPIFRETRVNTGTILTAAIAVGNFRVLSTEGMNFRPFHIRNDRFFILVFGAANTAVDMGVRWRELRS